MLWTETQYNQLVHNLCKQAEYYKTAHDAARDTGILLLLQLVNEEWQKAADINCQLLSRRLVNKWLF